ncbi:hypothetical protein GCM10009803_15320 [Microbacterium ginsengiterrae]
MASLRTLVDAYAPYPALLLDDRWDIIDANHAAGLLLAHCESSLLEPPVNAIRLVLHPEGLAPRIRNIETLRNHLVHQLEQRIRRRGDDRFLRSLHTEITSSSRIDAVTAKPADPAILLELETDIGLLRMFSVASQIEGPTDVTIDSLHLETFMPADEDTRLRLFQHGAE